MNQFLRYFVLFNFFVTAQPLTLHATAHVNAVHEQQYCVIINKSSIDYTLLIFHNYLHGNYTTLTIEAHSNTRVAIYGKTGIHAISKSQDLTEKCYGIVAEHKGIYVIQEGLELKP